MRSIPRRRSSSGRRGTRLLPLGSASRRRRHEAGGCTLALLAAERVERGGDGAVDAGVDGHAAVAGPHLDLCRAVVQAGAPADDAVALRVDRDEADVVGELRAQVAPEAVAAFAPQAVDAEHA